MVEVKTAPHERLRPPVRYGLDQQVWRLVWENLDRWLEAWEAKGFVMVVQAVWVGQVTEALHLAAVKVV